MHIHIAKEQTVKKVIRLEIETMYPDASGHYGYALEQNQYQLSLFRNMQPNYAKNHEC